MGTMTKDEINMGLFDRVKSLESQIAGLKEELKEAEQKYANVVEDRHKFVTDIGDKLRQRDELLEMANKSITNIGWRVNYDSFQAEEIKQWLNDYQNSKK